MIPSIIRILLLVLSVTQLSYSQETYETHISRRERHLDHWDAETLAAYLGLDPDTGKLLPDEENKYVGIDASIMFYASWCNNCHKFAPVWDTIGQLVQAGTTQSNLILALFNCELNAQHTRLCDASGVTFYPTLLFVGAGTYVDSDPVTSLLLGGKEKAAGQYGATKLKRTVKFQGNLNVGDSVLDWVRTMQGLSRWHKWSHMEGGWLKMIRSLFINPFEKKKKGKDKSNQNNSLPVGVPMMGHLSYSGSSNGSAKSPLVLQKELNEVENKVKSMKAESDKNKLATEHAGLLIDSFLFPKVNDSSDGADEKGALDVFSYMSEKSAWNKTTDSIEGSEVSIEKDEEIVVKTCVVDMTLDFCTRLSTKLTTKYLDGLDLLDEYPSFSEMEAQLRDIVKDAEPYCAKFDDCFANGFKDEDCRPTVCPFKNDSACIYVGACLSNAVMKEYKDALQESLSESSDTDVKK